MGVGGRTIATTVTACSGPTRGTAAGTRCTGVEDALHAVAATGAVGCDAANSGALHGQQGLQRAGRTAACDAAGPQAGRQQRRFLAGNRRSARHGGGRRIAAKNGDGPSAVGRLMRFVMCVCAREGWWWR